MEEAILGPELASRVPGTTPKAAKVTLYLK